MSICTDNKHMRRLPNKFTIDDVGSSLFHDLAQALYRTPEIIEVVYRAD